MEIAYPFVNVAIDFSGLQAVATRAPGVVAVVGEAADGDAGKPIEVDSIATVKEIFGEAGPLSIALQAVMRQRPAASKVYGIRIAADDEPGWKAAFAVLEGVKDVTFVSAAAKPIKAGAAGALDVVAMLKKHVEDASLNGSPRIGVAYIDPLIERAADSDYVDTVAALVEPYKSGAGRMIVFAARGATAEDGTATDLGAAAMSAVAGLAPETSILLKQVQGLKIAPEHQFSSSEIGRLAGKRIVPVIDPVFIPGGSLHFGEATTMTDDDKLGYVDVVRLLDDLDFALKANLIGLIGDARITRTGLYAVKRTLEGVLDGYVLRQAITSYRILIDILPVLEKPENTWTANDRQRVTAVRTSRVVNTAVLVVIGPAIHKINVALKPFYAMPE